MAPTATHDEAVPIEGYDDLKADRLNAQLRLRSQAELTLIDGYERSHQDRRAVLDKLRYLRSDEPLDGYDRLDTDEILAAAAAADTPTLGLVRGYEVRLRDREEVLSGLARIRGERITLPGSGTAPDQPAESWPGDADGGVKGSVRTVGVFALMAVAAALLLVLLAILAFVVIAAVAPDALIQ
jgi:hypothetical protein